MKMKGSTPKPTTAPAPEMMASTPAENVMRMAASDLMDVGGAVGADEPIGLAEDLLSGTGSDEGCPAGVKDYSAREAQATDLSAWTPSFSPWRHGGWYVDNVRYPSGAIGCVSNNYEDKKWRIACDPRPFDEQPTFKTRDAAARGEKKFVEDNWEALAKEDENFLASLSAPERALPVAERKAMLDSLRTMSRSISRAIASSESGVGEEANLALNQADALLTSLSGQKPTTAHAPEAKAPAAGLAAEVASDEPKKAQEHIEKH